MRHKITEILKNSLFDRIQEIKRKMRFNRRMLNLRNRRKASLKDLHTKFILEEEKDEESDMLTPLIEREESNLSKNLFEIQQSLRKIPSRNLEIHVNSGSSSSFSYSSSSIEQKSKIVEKKCKKSHHKRKRKYTVSKIPKFLGRQNTMIKNPMKLFRMGSMNSKNRRESNAGFKEKIKEVEQSVEKSFIPYKR